MSTPGPAVFLDKDGTLLVDVAYNVDPARMRFHEDVPAGLRALHAAGFALVVVSNQSGVARGLFPERALATVDRRLRAMFHAAGVPLAGFYYCPHLPGAAETAYDAVCGCRKPAAGLVNLAAAELHLDPARSWMVGDILDDVEAGARAGCATVLLLRGSETEWRPGPLRMPTLSCATFEEAAGAILAARELEAVG